MKKQQRIAWAFYDFATTPVAFAVNSMYLPLIIISLGGTNLLVGGLPLITGVVAIFWTPIAGVLIDFTENQSKLRRTLLFVSSLTASVAIMVIGVADSLLHVIVAFMAMSTAIQTGWTAANSFLAVEEKAFRLGETSGFGILIGYLGGGIGAGGAVIMELFLNRSMAILFIASFLLLFSSIPAIFLKDTHTNRESQMDFIGGIRETFTEIRGNRSVSAFIIASIFWGDAVSTVVTFASLIAVDILQIPASSASLFLAMALPGAIVGAYFHGKTGDSFGIVKTLGFNLVIWSIGITTIICTGGLIPNTIIATIAGFALGGNLTLSRALYAKIIPEGMEGRLFGISAIFTFFGGAIGPLLTGLVADFPGIGLRNALIIPLAFVISSIPLLYFIRE